MIQRVRKKIFSFFKKEKPQKITFSVKDGEVFANIVEGNVFAETEVFQQIKIGSIKDFNDSVRILNALKEDRDLGGIFFSVSTSERTMDASIGSRRGGTTAFLKFDTVLNRIEKRGKDWLKGLTIDPFFPGWDD